MACTSSENCSGGGGAVAITIPTSYSPCRLPRRIRRRLSGSKGPVTVEEIEAKLNEASHRRQRFYDFVSSKARSKQRSPLRPSTYEAKFNAAEKKRLSILSKAQMRLARCWRRFVTLKGTTCSLTKVFQGMDITQKSVGSMPFEQLAFKIESNASLQAVKSFLDRLEIHLRVRRGTSCSAGLENIDHLLERIATPNRRRNHDQIKKVGSKKRPISGRESTQRRCRYPVRIVLCAFMVLGHPDSVLSGRAAHETALVKAALVFIEELEFLIKIILEGPCVKSHLGNSQVTFRSQLEAFDKAWCLYLYCFVAWKVKDAKVLEDDLVRAACQLELSMMHTCKVTSEDVNACLTHDMNAIQKQVIEDQMLLKEKVQNLSGLAGVERMNSALSDVRAKFLISKDSGSPFSAPVAHIRTPGYSDSSDCSPSRISDEASDMAGENKHSSSVVRSLFKEDDTSASPSAPVSVGDVHLSTHLKVSVENELLVNEILHEHRRGVADKLDISDDVENSIKNTIETMEQAYWDGVTASMEQENPDFSWVLKLMTEIRDDLCEMSPGSWRKEITDAIDIDILTQVLRNKNVDMDYLGKLLEYALVNVQKLSAPATDDEMKAARQNLLIELGEISQAEDCSNSLSVKAIVKGVRFVLQQIKILKREISKARIRMLEPVVKGPAGLEYLHKAFLDRYGAPSDAPLSLPLTKSWLSPVSANADKVWSEYIDSLPAFSASQESYLNGIPSTTLRTGCSTSVTSRMHSFESVAKGKEQPECRGVGVDLYVRLGLLQLVSNIEGLEQETLPETLKLNVSRLRGVQSLLQRIIVISTSMLILRQILLSEHLVASSSDLDNIISQSHKQLSELLENDQDVGLKEIVEAILRLSDDVNVVDLEKVRAVKPVVANMLSKSLNSGDAVFIYVSQAVHLAARATLLGGTGSRGKQLAELSLRRIKATSQIENVIEIAEVLIVLATVSTSVHGSWYEQLLKKM